MTAPTVTHGTGFREKAEGRSVNATKQQADEYNSVVKIEGQMTVGCTIASPNILNPDTLWQQLEVESFGPVKLGRVLTMSEKLFVAVTRGKRLVCLTTKRDIDTSFGVAFVNLEYREVL